MQLPHRLSLAVAACATALLMVCAAHSVSAANAPASSYGRPTPVRSVAQFGAVGDGRTDDTAAIQRAIDSAWYLAQPGKPRQPGGVIYFPPGTYRTTRPLRLHSYVVLTGDEGQGKAYPLGAQIDSEADAALVCWEGAWRPGQQIDMQVRTPDGKGKGNTCVGVVVKNLGVRGRQYGLHTMGCDSNYMHLENCRFEGAQAGFCSTGNLFFSAIRDCAFEKALWIIAEENTRFNTSEISNILIGINGIQRDDWAIRLEGCIQCVSLRNITLEAQAKGLLIDAKYAGVNIAVDGLWSYDTRQPAEVVRIKSGEAIRVSNVLGTDLPSEFNVEGGSRVFLQGVLAKSIDLHGNESATVVGSSPVVNAGPGSVIEGVVVR